uniref:Target of myb1 like 2 membrane trafficking protein n=1 Tax=Oncorhynchus kisutch TaxID=8019 RepID=A0A8C7L3F3_ONCKI
MADLDTLSPIHTPQRGLPEVDPAVLKYKAPIQPHAAATATLPKPAAAPAPAPAPAPLTPILQIPHIPNVQGPITANPEQIARLRSELDIVRGNTKVMSEMLTEMVPGQEDSSDLELLQELNRTCRAMQQRVVELISRVSNEEVTEELLHVNDDLNNIFLRYERYERYRSGRAAQNNGMLSEATEDNLIDLTPGSPAVVSLRATSTPPSSIPPVTAPRAGATASPARTLIQDPTSGPSTLSTQLAGLDVGGVSVSGTLSSLSGHNPGDDFDMFAQTRTSSLADQRKNVKYEDPRALGGLASALDVRQQNATGGVSAPRHAGGCSLDSHPTTMKCRVWLTCC